MSYAPHLIERMNPTDQKPNTRSGELPDNSAFKISVFSKHLQWLEYPDMARAAAGMGFDGVDLTVRPGGHVLPERVAEDLPQAVEAVRKNGMEVFMISTAITDPDDKQTRTILKTAGDLGVKHYRTDWFPYDGGMSIKQNLKAFEIRFKRLAALNKKYGIQGDYQNHSGTDMGASIWDLWMILNEVGSEWVGSQYDIRHATVEGANSWPLGFELIRPYIGTLDFKDFYWVKDGERWQVKNIPLGEGMVDFDRYLKLLKKYTIRAPISLHCEYPLGGAEHGAESLEINGDTVLAAIEKDLNTLQNWLLEAGLK